MTAPKPRGGEIQRCRDCKVELTTFGYLCDRDPPDQGPTNEQMRCADCADKVCTPLSHGEDCNTSVFW